MNLWAMIYENGGVEGYSYNQIVWYLILTEFISFACRTTVHSSISEDVKTGSIAYQISRPVHYLFFQFANYLGQILVNAILFGAFAIFLGILYVGKLSTFSIYEIPAVVLSLLLSMVLNYFSLMTIGLCAFSIEDNFAIYLIYQKLGFILGMFLPLEFLPIWLQPIAKCMPFSYVYWAPAKLFVNYSFDVIVEVIPGQIVWTTFSIILCLFVYSRGIRRIQVNGG
jgi:ABC-2 type transport system permease protein